ISGRRSYRKKRNHSLSLRSLWFMEEEEERSRIRTPRTQRREHEAHCLPAFLTFRICLKKFDFFPFKQSTERGETSEPWPEQENQLEPVPFHEVCQELLLFCFFTLLCLQKKAGQDPPDFTKEKNYFQEVDSFELLEESPSPRNFGTWAMGTKHDIIVHDLPAILERWRISKLASRHGSQQLFKIMETPFVPSVHSTASSASNDLAAKTPERVFRTKAPLNVTSHKKILTPLVDNSIVSSFDALHIDEEEVANIMSEDVETSREGLDSDKLEEATQMDPSISQRASLTGEYLSTFDQLMMKSEEVLEEVMLSLTLNNLKGTRGETNKENTCTGFIETKEYYCKLICFFYVCQGAYDAGLISAWEDWDARHSSENDHPKEFTEKQKRTAKDERDLRSFKKRLSSYNSATASLADSLFSDMLVDCSV
ncbi:hypothetical protein BHM03_00042484, partial [Ensete ventricosum]